MIMSILTATAIIVPVNLDDALLSQPDTLLSDQARSLIVEAGEGNLHCLDLPEGQSEYARVCLTAGDWHVVLSEAERDAAKKESRRARDRAITLASVYSR